MPPYDPPEQQPLKRYRFGSTSPEEHKATNPTEWQDTKVLPYGGLTAGGEGWKLFHNLHLRL